MLYIPALVNWEETIRQSLPEEMQEPSCLAELEEVLEQIKVVLDPKILFCSYSTFQIQGFTLQIEQTSLHIGPIMTSLFQDCHRIIVLLGTLGEGITQLIQQYTAENDWIKVYWCDTAANLLLDEAIQQLLKVEVKDGNVTFPVSPGCCNWKIQEQTQLFSLIDAGSIHVQLLSSYLMQPLKSISALVGVSNTRVFEQNECHYCGRKGCPYSQYRIIDR